MPGLHSEELQPGIFSKHLFTYTYGYVIYYLTERSLDYGRKT